MIWKENPLVSVIIPVFNGEAYLAEAIESALGQTYPPLEVIIIDDGSTDRSAEIARRYIPAVRYQHQPNAGVGAALNRGIEAAEGDFLAFLDSDDLWVGEKIARQIAAFEGDPGLDVVFGHVQQFGSAEAAAGTSGEGLPGYLKGTMLVRRETFRRVGRFDSKWRVGDFVDWYARAVERGLRGLMLPEIVMRRRIHADNMGIREREHRTDFARILKASLDRRRAQIVCAPTNRQGVEKAG